MSSRSIGYMKFLCSRSCKLQLYREAKCPLLIVQHMAALAVVLFTTFCKYLILI